jgi:hypothetical protein
MPTKRTFSFDYNCSVETVAALLHDANFLRSRCEAAGDQNVDIQIEKTPDGVSMVVSRERTIDLPAFVRGLVPPRNRATERTTWRRVEDSWQADYSVEVAGLPGKVRGRSLLTETGSGTHYESTFEVSAGLPLIGRRIEGLVADGFVEQLAINAERNAKALEPPC